MLRQRVSAFITGRPIEQLLREAYVTIRELIPDALVSREERKSRRYDELTLDIARAVMDDTSTYVDAGAHAGTMLKHLRHIAPRGHGYAFEPIPNLAAGLARRFGDVDVINAALGAANDETTFHVVVGNPSDSSVDERPERTANYEVRDIAVVVRRLDECVLAQHRVAFIKIDVEGAELAVFRGASRILGEDRPVVVFESSSLKLAAIMEVLSEHRYGVDLLENFRRRPAPGCDELVELARDRGEYYFVASPLESS